MNQAVQFGAYSHLSGIFRNSEDKSSDTCVIIVTAGMLHHAGPFRLHVDLAKRVANKGLSSFRFDLSGIGESFGIGESGCSLDRASEEIRLAIDYVATNHAVRNVILFGLCSGADDAMATAIVDPRVVGVVAMDGCGYRTSKFHWHRLLKHYGPRLLRLKKWKKLVGRLFVQQASVPSSMQPGGDVREFPERKEAAIQIGQLAQQGTHLHFFYTGGVSDYFNHSAQFRKMFPELKELSDEARGRVTSEFWPEIDHVAYLCEDRARLIDHLAEKMHEISECHSSLLVACPI